MLAVAFSALLEGSTSGQRVGIRTVVVLNTVPLRSMYAYRTGINDVLHAA